MHNVNVNVINVVKIHLELIMYCINIYQNHINRVVLLKENVLLMENDGFLLSMFKPNFSRSSVRKRK